ncbi:MAG TPA: VOC family protein [Thermoplasmata archaeon]|nr:VOC family protein [Thermoplasmata archaeon]
MHVESLTVQARPGKEKELLAHLQAQATQMFNALGCYAAYVLRDSQGPIFTRISFWADKDAASKSFPEGLTEVPAEWREGRPQHRTFESAAGPGSGSPLVTYVAIRVTDFERSLRFYTSLFGFEAVGTVRSHPRLGSKIVMLRNPRTGQQLELNWYPPGSRFGTPYVAGEALDHIGVRVPDLPKVIEKARELGSVPVDLRPFLDLPFQNEAEGIRVAYLQDPDGNQIEVYDIAGLSVDAPFGGGY